MFAAAIDNAAVIAVVSVSVPLAEVGLTVRFPLYVILEACSVYVWLAVSAGESTRLLITRDVDAPGGIKVVVTSAFGFMTIVDVPAVKTPHWPGLQSGVFPSVNNGPTVPVSVIVEELARKVFELDPPMISIVAAVMLQEVPPQPVVEVVNVPGPGPLISNWPVRLMFPPIVTV